MSSSTDLHFPAHFPYPISIVSLDVKPNDSVTRGLRLLTYSFVYLPPTAPSQPETRYGTWDCAVDGSVVSLNTKAGDVWSAKRAKDKPIVVVLEPCKHGVQIGGLCGLCGKDMTDFDYTGYSDASRASIQMSHSAFGPTLSYEEAQKLEKQTAEHLFKSRKLSLIVDLDQTIVHATVDPTVGEWIAEGLLWESKRDSEGAEDTPCNPNWEALKDVKSFKLAPEFPQLQKGKGKVNFPEVEACMYYIKPRPGWETFFKEMSELYEMHVYTMGTRSYAEQVCAAIDPEGKYFGGRILSRDESGSLTQKSLRRLFPCDTSMVVIIDDRADVWEWSPNLIKVVPFDFFVGIGDINSTFLPKVNPIGPAGAPVKPTPTPKVPPIDTALAASEEAERAQREKAALLTQNSLALEAQMDDRPLAKKQEELQEDEAEQEPPESQLSDSDNESTHSTKQKHPHKALLKNDDSELERLSQLMTQVHSKFYEAYEESKKHKHHRSKGLSYDVTKIIPKLRQETLKGVNIVFSSVIPLDTKPESTEIWNMATMFGARCFTDLTPEITHVVAAKRGTMKVDAARKRPNVKVVWLNWFTDCIAQWRRQDEGPYLLEDPPIAGPSSSPGTDAHQISSDPDPDADDWNEMETKHPGDLDLGEIDWGNINDEVEAAMNESDDETADGRSEASAGDNVSEDEMLTETPSRTSSAPGTPRKRKRLRSSTPGELENGRTDLDLLRSPLSKRKKVVAERSGASRLKEGITAGELRETTPSRDSPNGSVIGGDSDKDSELDDEDDFLIGDMEQETDE